MKVYISGKITGLPINEVKIAFASAAEHLKSRGHDPINPLDNGLSDDMPWEKHMLEDIKMLFGCQAIYLLSTWYDSRGARIEKMIAETLGLKIMFEKSSIANYLELVADAIFEVTSVTMNDMRRKGRKDDFFYPRMIYAYYAKQAGQERKVIAEAVNRQDCMINYYVKRFPIEMKYKGFRENVEKINDILQKSVSL